MRRIGLSLGADLCWPAFFEDIVAELGPLKVSGEEIGFEVERVTIEPFNLRQPATYDLVIDRLTPWYHTSREWLKKAILMDDVYVLNSPFTLQSMQKHTSYAAMLRLGLPIPETWLLPPREYEESADLDFTLDRYAKLFDLDQIGNEVGYPAYLKPYDGGAWEGVSRVENTDQLRDAYNSSGTRIMHLQQAVHPYDLFVRALGIGPQVNLMRYDPEAPLHERYLVEFDFVDNEEWLLLRDMSLTINSFFGWDFNSCETLRRGGEFFPIDFANGNPDSQVTSLHFHLPWLVKSMIRWTLFCAAFRRPMTFDLRWPDYFAIADSDRSYREKLTAYAGLARERYETDKFEEFCETHLGHLDEIALEYIGTEKAREAVATKVAAMFPAHEVAEFTEHFWGLLQLWRKTESDRLLDV
ncbi:MAG TPA: hypothetical protein VIW94_11705 [Acidimicrobiia bacterium]